MTMSESIKNETKKTSLKRILRKDETEWGEH